MGKLLLFILILFLSACNYKSRSSADVAISIDFKDSVISEYFKYIDSLGYYDTLNRDFKTLRAYVKNDTSFFRELSYEIEGFRRNEAFMSPWDSCIRNKKLSVLGVDEAIRFRHWQAFCFFGQAITITKKGDSMNLHYVEHSNGDGQTWTFLKHNGDTLVVNPYCTVVKEFNKSLPMKDWISLKKKIVDVGYWQMKEKAGGGLDGSIWQIDAYYTKEHPAIIERRAHSVYRHSLYSEGFKELGLLILSLSGEKTMCDDFH